MLVTSDLTLIYCSSSELFNVSRHSSSWKNLNMFDDSRGSQTSRVCSDTEEPEGMDAERSADEPNVQEKKDVSSLDLEVLIGLSRAKMAPRSTKMFTEGNGAPRTSGMDKISSTVTLYMIKLAKEIVFDLFKYHNDAVNTP